MKRRKILIGLGALGAGGAATAGTGAFTSVKARRKTPVQVRGDDGAYLRLTPCEGSPNSEYASIGGSGTLRLDLESTNNKAESFFDDVFTIRNEGTQPVGVCINKRPNGAVDPERVVFYTGTADGQWRPDNRIDDCSGDTAPLTLCVGEEVCVGVAARTQRNNSSAKNQPDVGDTLLKTVDIIADADSADSSACGETSGGEAETTCNDCSFDGSSAATSPEVTVESTDASSFPEVTTFLDIDTTAGTEGTLASDDFALCEDGCGQTVDASFTSEDKPVDFVFLMDVTGSMGGELDGVKAEVQDFTDAVESEGIDARYALYLFGDEEETGEPAVFLKQDFTGDSGEFDTAVQNTSLEEEVGYGGDFPEDNYEVILTADDELSYRTGSQRVMIDITDAPGEEDEGDTVGGLAEIRANAVSVLEDYTYIAVSPDDDGTHQKKPLADEVGGMWIELGTDFDPILGAVEDEVASSYRLRYTTTNPVADGSTREIDIRIEDPDGTLFAESSYTAPSS